MLGNLRERVTIQTFTESSDGGGGSTRTWSNLATVWAEVKPVSRVADRERVDTGRLATIQTYLVTIRHRTGFDTSARLLWGSKYLNIRSIENRDLRKRFLVLECQEGVNNG